MRAKNGVGLIVAVLLGLAAVAWAGTKAAPDVRGWEPGSEYDKLFDPKEIDVLKGRVTKIYESAPLPDMAAGIILQVEDKKDKGLETVQMGPKDFVDVRSIDLRVGDQVKVVGAWAEMDGQDVMLAVKVKKDGKTLKVRRTKDGAPFWAMSPEQRAREGAND